MISIGKKIGFISDQTGDSIKTLETYYKRYFPAESDIEIPGEEEPLLPGDKPGSAGGEFARNVAC